jgi:hypothetical protein
MSAYANHYAEGAGRRRRRVYFTTTSIVAAMALGGVIGSALTAVYIHSQRAIFQHSVCVLRTPDDGLMQTGFTRLSGICETRR